MTTEQKVTRKLRAILSADVKGYSILMADDEIFTIKTIKEYRSIISACINQYNGRVVDSPGDNILAEFASAVDAVQCAVEIQNKLKKENERLVENKRLEFRIGVNIGDVVHDDDRIYGDGVNVASRIEGLADPGGVCISRGAYDQIKKKLGFGFEYLGEQPVKNISEPVRVYKVIMDSGSYVPLVREPHSLPDKPSIAVLPFDNMSGESNQEYFSDGLSEQIINGLCKISNLFVIARNSSFAYKGKSISIKQVAKELGVKYILEGSVQRVGDQVRITAQLIDATTEYHMWSESYDRNISDIFALQDEITQRLIDAMHIELTFGKQAHQWKVSTPNLQAYDKFLRGLDHFFRGRENDNKDALQFFKEAIEIDNNYAFAYTMLGFTCMNYFMWGSGDSPLEFFVEAEKNAEKALALNDSLDVAHSLLGWVYLFKRQYEDAIKEGGRAIELNPNGADAHAVMAAILSYSGNPSKAIKLLQIAFRLNPIPLPHYYIFMAMAYRVDGQYEKSIEWCKKCIADNPDLLSPYITMASSYILLNQYKEASRTVVEIQRIDPNFSLEQLKLLPYKHQETTDILIESIRKAGIPE